MTLSDQINFVKMLIGSRMFEIRITPHTGDTDDLLAFMQKSVEKLEAVLESLHRLQGLEK